MAITHKFTRTLPSPSTTHSDGFVFLLSTAWFTQADQGVAGSPVDGGVTSLANGGGDLQIFSDTNCTNRLPIEVIRFVTGVSPDCQVWVRTPTYTAGDSITIGRDDTQVSQPAVTDTYGRNNVWQDYSHVGSNVAGMVDSTGNTTLSLTNTATQSGNIKGIDAVSIDGTTSSCVVFDNTSADTWTGDFTVGAWLNLDSLAAGFAHVIGIRESNLWEFSFRLETNQPALLIGTASPNSTGTLSTLTDYFLTCTVSGTNISFYINGALAGTQTVSGTRTDRAFDITFGGLKTSTTGTSIDGRIALPTMVNGVVFSADKIADIYSSQNDADNFGTSSEWVEFGVTGITVTASFDSSGAITVGGSTNISLNADNNISSENDNSLTSIVSSLLDNTVVTTYSSNTLSSVSNFNSFNSNSDNNILLESSIDNAYGSSSVTTSNALVFLNITSTLSEESLSSFNAVGTVVSAGNILLTANFGSNSGFNSLSNSLIIAQSNLLSDVNIENTLNSSISSSVNQDTLSTGLIESSVNINSVYNSDNTTTTSLIDVNSYVGLTSDYTSYVNYTSNGSSTITSIFNHIGDASNELLCNLHTVSSNNFSVDSLFTSFGIVGTFNPLLSASIAVNYEQYTMNTLYIENNISSSYITNTITINNS